MKFTSLLLATALILLPIHSYAACPNYNTNGVGPQSPVCPGNYYTFDSSCPSKQGVSAVTMSCFYPGFTYTTAYSYTDYQMVVPSGHGSSCKDVEIFVDFNSP